MKINEVIQLNIKEQALARAPSAGNIALPLYPT